MKLNRLIYFTILFKLLLLIINNNTFAIGNCDNTAEQRYCLGNALRTSNNSFDNPQYIDVRLLQSIQRVQDKMTFECWLRPEFTSGRRQYIAGIWGPSYDINDVWVVYHNEQNQLVFEVNHPTTNDRDNDNLKVSTNVTAQMIGQWFHFAATFDGATQTITMYINGNQVAQNINTDPSKTFDKLRVIQNPQLTMQIASTNALSNSSSNLSYKGWIDELRLWSRVVDSQSLICNKDLSLNGDEPNLELYYRFNEPPNQFQICDASGNDNTGFLRSGANLEQANRPNPRPFKITSNFPDTIKCVNNQTYTFTITDTSLCGSRGRVRILKGGQYLSTSDNNFKPLPYNTPVSFNVTFSGDVIGFFDAQIVIDRDNRCGGTIVNLNKKIYRQTQISVPIDTLEFGILKVKCIEERYIDLPIPVCNTSSKVGVAGVKNVTSVSFKYGTMFSLASPATPMNIYIDNCRDLIVRFRSNDIPGRYFDTLYINTDDNCIGRKAIALSGTIEDIVAIKKNGTEDDFEEIDFGSICVGVPSSTFLYTWENMSSNDIFVDSAYINMPFQMSRTATPITLEPRVKSRERYIRFFPQSEGIVEDSIILYFKAGKCTVRKLIKVKGVGIDPKVRFTMPNFDFGSVIIGQEVILPIEVENYGIVEFDLQFDLAKGDAFFFPGSRGLKIPPGQKRTIDIMFRPTKEEDYFDELRLYEPRCFKNDGIPIKGKGIYERFKFEPELMRIDFVLACDKEIDTLYIENITNSPQTLRNFVLDDPSGKFVTLFPNNLATFNVTLQANQKQMFIFEYTPNDVILDRADRAFLRYRTNDNVDWNAKLYGTSLLPKLYLTDNNVWGTQEVGQSINKTIVLENISSVDIKVDNANIDDIIGAGAFTLLNPNNFVNKTLKPRDTLHAIVRFNPTSAIDFESELIVNSTSPCNINTTTKLTGKGRVFPLEVITNLISYGYVNPCDCAERKIPLVNNSTVFSATIDNIEMLSNGNPDSRPYNFKWYSDFSPSGVVPYEIPPRKPNDYSVDTLRVLFCPNSPNVRDSLNHDALLKLTSSGSGWSLELERYLAGKRNLFAESYPTWLNFPDTRVDIVSAGLYSNVTIPELGVNPDRAPLIIDSITFTPNQRVFTASDSLGRPFPITVIPNEYLPVKIEFKPRAAKFYAAKMTIHFRQPCNFADTSVYVNGWGFAPAFGLKFGFDDFANNSPEEKMIKKCDTLRLPVYTSRRVPGKYVNIESKVSYNTTEFDFIGVESSYMNKNCSAEFIPELNYTVQTNDKIHVKSKNFCDVDSINPIYNALFTPKTNKATNINFVVDSIFFDTEDVLLYAIIAESGNTNVDVLDVDFQVQKGLDFGTVRILNCSQDSLTIVNTGDFDIIINDLITPHQDVNIISTSLPLTDYLVPNGQLTIVFEFCPKQKYDFSEDLIFSTLAPCEITKSRTQSGISFAPEVNVSPLYSLSNASQTFSGVINDTITIPIYFDTDLTVNYNNIDYWLEDLNFITKVNYNKTALKYLDYENTLNANINVIEQNGLLTFEFNDIDSLKRGKILDLKFKVVVPDSTISEINTQFSDFISTKIMFLDLIPENTKSTVEVNGKCAIDTFIFTELQSIFVQNYPNPWSDETKIEFECGEELPVKLNIFDASGKLVKSIYDGSKVFKIGKYEVTLLKGELSTGTYYCKYEIGDYSKIIRMMIK